MSLAMLKAARQRGAAGYPCLSMMATQLLVTLTSIAEGKSTQEPVEAEGLLREALVVGAAMPGW